MPGCIAGWVYPPPPPIMGICNNKMNTLKQQYSRNTDYLKLSSLQLNYIQKTNI